MRGKHLITCVDNCLVYICGTPYVCLYIIFLYTPIIIDVTRTANWERVPNVALPKLGRVPTPLWESHWTRTRRKERWREEHPCYCPLLNHRVNMLLPEYVCLTDAMHSRFYWSSKIYIWNRYIWHQWIYAIIIHWTILGSHSVWLNSFGYRCISLDTQELYLLLLIGIGHASLIFGQSLLGIVVRYLWTNKIYIWRIFDIIE